MENAKKLNELLHLILLLLPSGQHNQILIVRQL